MPLHADAVVVRGGSFLTVKALEKPLALANDKGYGNALSVFVDVKCTDDGPGMTLAELCQPIERYRLVRFSTVDKLAAAGIEVEEPRRPSSTHCHALLGDPVEESAAAFIECFDEPTPNPARGEEGSG